MIADFDLEALITELVQAAPRRDPRVVHALIDGLHALATPLALAIARIVELVAEDLVDPGIALPALAMAIATLADARSTPRDLEAARYEIDTLQPMPDGARPISPLAPIDVPANTLVRKKN